MGSAETEFASHSRNELLARYRGKDMTRWLGNSPEVANKHCAMAMQAGFDQVVIG